jgi:hypothetical protein
MILNDVVIVNYMQTRNNFGNSNMKNMNPSGERLNSD